MEKLSIAKKHANTFSINIRNPPQHANKILFKTALSLAILLVTACSGSQKIAPLSES
jgi:hypothetical protein